MIKLQMHINCNVIRGIRFLIELNFCQRFCVKYYYLAET